MFGSRDARFSHAMDWLFHGVNHKNAYLNAQMPYDVFPQFNNLRSCGIRVLCASSYLKELEKTTGTGFLESAGAVHKLHGDSLWIVDNCAELPSVDLSACSHLAERKMFLDKEELGLVAEWYLIDAPPKVSHPLSQRHGLNLLGLPTFLTRSMSVSR